jgi:hypothetical protein
MAAALAVLRWVSDCLWLQAPTASPAPMGKSDRPEKTVTLSC